MEFKDDITDQEVWSKIARAYEEVITQTSAYRRFEKDILAQVNASLRRRRQSGARGMLRVLDVGCGLGNVINSLLEQNTDIEAVGIDTNKHMLKRAERVIGKNLNRVELFHTDAMKMSHRDEFDVVVSSNVVFNLKKPFSFFDKCYDALLPGGEFVVTSAMPEPNLSGLVDIARQELNGEDIGQLIDIAESMNKKMMDGKFHTFKLNEICEVLTKFCRFEKVTEMQTSYNGQNFLVSAEKSSLPLDLAFEVARGRNRFNESLRLKYHILVERNHLLEPNPERIFLSRYDPHSISFQIVDKRTRTVYACLGHTLDSHLGFPMEESTDISQYRSRGIPLGNFNTIYTVHAMQGHGLGKFVLSLAQDYLRRKGEVSMVLAEANPEVENLCIQCGAVIFPGASTTPSGLPKIDMYFDLQDGENMRKVDAVIDGHQEICGKLAIIESDF